MKALVTRLRIAGFKSFAEPVALDILPGLTGIVGPNGCGKSNVVEALRWAMGETSARSLRGGEMDDVIFAGTVARASRNLAEVTVTLEGELPEPFEAGAELTLTRRIERGAGSAFRANGREVRARDVQTLYADLSSGARSSGMVSQGRVSALVSAKPEERRQVLEEAAGITGLHARRHEAELKLRAAEQNLSRAEDLRVQLAAGAETLRKQAKVSSRYRNISGLIRAAEGEYLAILSGQAEAARAAAEAGHASAVLSADQASEAVRAASRALTETQAAIAEPRSQEASCRSVLERRRIEVESVALESEQATRALADAERRLREVETDLADAAGRRDEAAALCGRLSAEVAALAGAIAALPSAIEQAMQASAAAADAERNAVLAADSAAASAVEATAAARQAEHAMAAAAAALETARARHAQCRQEHAALSSRCVDPSLMEEAQAQDAGAAEALVLARRSFDAVDMARAAAGAAEAAAVSRALKLTAEHDSAVQRVAALRRVADSAATACAELTAAAAAAESQRPAASVIEKALREAAVCAEQAGEAEMALEAAEEAVRCADASRNAAAARAADSAAEASRLRGLVEEARRAVAGLTSETAAHQARLAAAVEARPDPRVAEAARASAAAASGQLEACRLELTDCMARCQAAHAHLAATRAAAASLAAEAQRLAAEANGIEAVLAGAPGQNADRAIDHLDVPPGLEAAVAAALGEAAEHALDPAATRHWATLPMIEGAPLPVGGAVLASLIAAPDALARTLSQAFVVEAADGSTIQRSLLPGQIAVSREGDAWRWDGPVTRAGAPTSAAVRLQQRNRLEVVRIKAGLAGSEASTAQAKAVEAEAAVEAAVAREAQATAASEAVQEAVRATSTACAAAEASALEATVRYEALLPTSSRLAEALGAAEGEFQTRSAAHKSLPDPALAGASLAEREAQLAAARDTLTAARDRGQMCREAAFQAQDHARRVTTGAETVAQRAALIEPQRLRARQESEAANAAWRRADELLADLDDPRHSAAEAEAASLAAAAAARDAETARLARADAEAAADQTRERRAFLTAQHHQTQTSLAAMTSLVQQAATDERAADEACASAAAALQALADAAALATAATEARAMLADARQASMRAAACLQSLTADQAQSGLRQSGLASELAGWRSRLGEAEARAEQLETRAEAVRLDASVAAAGPADIGLRAEQVQAALAAAEARHSATATALATAESETRSAGVRLREADGSEAGARAALARAEGMLEASRGALEAVRSRLAERQSHYGEAIGPTLPVPADLSEAAEERARRRAERLTRERDDMGPVNLRADIELAELDERAAALERERDELNAAIAKLRGAIGHINREGRARLTAVFTEVDRHFRTLFTRTMGGGRAHLALTGSDDPLLAGLEIYAEPPGKKLSTLSLLSGGEQALTALSLIFAVFRCTPAPISVLDEVDAPLDDANVERFCNLLHDVVRDTGTRFLVVTHHQLTMSRMDRLFGVTMQERGISRLLSVDLQHASAMVEETLQAAE